MSFLRRVCAGREGLGQERWPELWLARWKQWMLVGEANRRSHVCLGKISPESGAVRGCLWREGRMKLLWRKFPLRWIWYQKGLKHRFWKFLGQTLGFTPWLASGFNCKFWSTAPREKPFPWSPCVKKHRCNTDARNHLGGDSLQVSPAIYGTGLEICKMVFIQFIFWFLIPRSAKFFTFQFGISEHI